MLDRLLRLTPRRSGSACCRPRAGTRGLPSAVVCRYAMLLAYHVICRQVAYDNAGNLFLITNICGCAIHNKIIGLGCQVVAGAVCAPELEQLVCSLRLRYSPRSRKYDADPETCQLRCVGSFITRPALAVTIR